MNGLIEKLDDLFFENNLIKEILTEAAQEVNSDDDLPAADNQIPDQANVSDEAGSSKIDTLKSKFQSGEITQDDLIKMYKNGEITQNEIQQIIQDVQNTDAQQPTEEELFAQQIEQTNDLFIKFALYDKTIELSEKLKYFKENFKDTNSELYTKVMQINEFLNILSNLIFNLETSVSYQMYGNILFQLTDLFEKYSKRSALNKEKIDI
jgi:hypothetical protein